MTELEHDHIEQTLRFVSQRGWSNSGEEFIPALARHLSSLLEVDFVFVGKLLADRESVATMTLLVKGEIVNNFEYGLRGTPCENVIGQTTCIYPRNIQSLFPDDQLLADMGIESYGGTPLWDAKGNALGLLAVMHGSAFENVELIRSQLQLVATRVAAELERNEFERSLRQSKDSLLEAQRIAMMGSWELDRASGRRIWSEEVFRILGCELPSPPANMEELSQYFTPASWACLSAAIEQGLTQGTPFKCDMEVPRSNGANRWVSSRGEVVRDGTGSVIGLRGTIQDITERKTIEDAVLLESKKYETLLRAAGDGVHVIDLDGNVIQANDAFCRMLGYTAVEMQAMNVAQWDSKWSSAELKVRIRDLMASSVTFETRHRRRDGSIIDVEINTVGVEINGQQMLFCASRDITEHKQLLESLRLSDMVLEHSSEGMVVTDKDNRIIAVNPAFTTITGYNFEDVQGKNPRMFSSGRHDRAFYQAMWQALNSTGRWQGEIWDKRKNGELHAKLLTINTIYNETGGVYRHVALFSDITEKKKSEELIWQQANFDALTGLPNRRMFRDRLEQEIMKSERASLPLALLLIDLDEFKEVNDTQGHDAGDILLKEAALRIADCVRASDTVARLGGDEFTVVLSQLPDANHAEVIAQKILMRLSEPFHLGNEVSYVSASIGITLYPNDATSVESLMKNADQAMYLSKYLGRNRFSYFTPALQEAAQKRLQMTNELRGALAANQFEVYYQPIVELATGNIHKAEALIRWHHPERGMVSPAEFIPLAEESGLILEIGFWVFQQAAHQVHRWKKLFNADFQISVNRSPVQFQDHARENHMPCLNYLDELRLPGRGVVFEITEGLLLDAHTGVTDTLLKFSEAGIQVALDDFGTGYSSLSYLKKFDIDYLKIDKSFVDHLSTDGNDVALCEAIIVMAHKLGLQVIAEGVETEAQRKILADAGCDYGQGYLFSRPVPPQEFEKLLA